MGVDIGCGMCAVPVDGLFKQDLSEEKMRRLQALIKERIPTSFDSHAVQLSWAKGTLNDISSVLGAFQDATFSPKVRFSLTARKA